MINISRNSISKFLAFVVVILVLPGVIYYFYTKSDQAYESQKLSFDQGFSEFLTQLNKRWRYGDIEGHWGTNNFECADIPRSLEGMNPEVLKCNPVYINCWLTGGIPKLDPIIKTKNHVFHADTKNLSIINHGDLKIDFVEKTTNTEFSVRLERNCHQAFLPEKVYSSGPDASSLDVWDNYGRKIFVDKFYVSNFDVKFWKTKEFSINSNDLKPALNLTKAEQQEYCQYRGKKLLQNHIFEASTFFPSVYKKGYLFKSKIPWAKIPKVNELITFTKKNCVKNFTKECLVDQKLNSFSNLSTSWIGIYHSLGSELESFDNIFHKAANLKVSSKYTSISSLWNMNSKRATWSGQSYDRDSFNFTEFYSGDVEDIMFEQLKGVAFRCMSIK
jgi:hypothetical protein